MPSSSKVPAISHTPVPGVPYAFFAGGVSTTIAEAPEAGLLPRGGAQATALPTGAVAPAASVAQAAALPADAESIAVSPALVVVGKASPGSSAAGGSTTRLCEIAWSPPSDTAPESEEMPRDEGPEDIVPTATTSLNRNPKATADNLPKAMREAQKWRPRKQPRNQGTFLRP